MASELGISALDFNAIEELANSILLMSRKNIQVGDKVIPFGVHTNHDLYSSALAGYINGLMTDVLRSKKVEALSALSEADRADAIFDFHEKLSLSVQKVKTKIQAHSVQDTRNVNELFGDSQQLKEWVLDLEVNEKDIYNHVKKILDSND